MLIAAARLPSLLWRDGFTDAYFATAFLAQLREAERFARKALLRDARAIAVTLPPAKPDGRTRRVLKTAPQAFTMDHQRWRVGFRLTPRAGTRAARRKEAPEHLLGPTPAQARSQARFELALQPADMPNVEPAVSMPRHTPRGCRSG